MFYEHDCEHPTRLFFFFFNDTATTEIYTLSLHDALPISPPPTRFRPASRCATCSTARTCSCTTLTIRSPRASSAGSTRSEEHTSELQSLAYLVCRLLLEKKKHKRTSNGDVSGAR